ITEQSIRPQKIQLRADVNTLQDLQQLLGEINWIRPTLGISNEELAPLFGLLKGDCNINSSKTITPEAQKTLEKVTTALQQRQAHSCAPEKPFFLAVLREKTQLYGLIFQWDTSQKDSLLIIEWIFLPYMRHYRSPKTILTTLEMTTTIIIKGRTRLLAMAGQDFAVIHLPLKREYFDWALQNSEDLQVALLSYSDVCSTYFPSHKLLQAKFSFTEKPLLNEVPLDAVTLFTDG
ncbi:POK11 protein, partial [Eulacestoma nigropectus]|nr:POK11 protein [Eulacestoma nigropectus]